VPPEEGQLFLLLLFFPVSLIDNSSNCLRLRLMARLVVLFALVEAAAPTSIDERQWQGTRPFIINSTAAIQRSRTPVAHVIQDPRSRVTLPDAARRGSGSAFRTHPAPRFGSMHDSFRSQQIDHPTKHPHPSSSSRRCPTPSAPLSTQRNNSNTSVDKAITMHHHDAGQL